MDFLSLSNTCLLTTHSITCSWRLQSNIEGDLASSPEELISSWPHLLLLSLFIALLLSLWLPRSSSNMPSTRLLQRFSTYCFFHLNSSCSRYFTLLTPRLKVTLTREAFPNSPHKRAHTHTRTRTRVYPFTIPYPILLFFISIFYHIKHILLLFMSLLSVFPPLSFKLYESTKLVSFVSCYIPCAKNSAWHLVNIQWIIVGRMNEWSDQVDCSIIHTQ